MSKEIFVLNEVSVMKKADWESFLTNGEFDYKIYTAEMLSNKKVRINDEIYTSYMFNKLYTKDLC